MKPLRTGCMRAAALAWLTRTVGSGASGTGLARIERLQLAGQRQGLRQFDDLDRWRGIDSELRRHGAVVVDIWRDEVVRAAPERGDGQQQSRKAGFTERRIPSLPALLRN
jgi:hypothetical protein